MDLFVKKLQGQMNFSPSELTSFKIYVIKPRFFIDLYKFVICKNHTYRCILCRYERKLNKCKISILRCLSPGRDLF